jgi:hypothetical protein
MASRKRITYAPKSRRDRRHLGKIKVDEINKTLSRDRKPPPPSHHSQIKKEEGHHHSVPSSSGEEIKRIRKLQLILQAGTTHWVNTSFGKRNNFELTNLGLADIIDQRPDHRDSRLSEYYVHYRECKFSLY